MRAVVVYFSLSGHTKYAAEAVALKLGAEIVRLEVRRPYPTGRKAQLVLGGFETVFGKTRRLKPYRFGKNKYELVVLATPVWAGKFAPPMKRFLRENDLGGIPTGLIACCGGGSTQGCMANFKSRVKNVIAELSLVDPSAKDAAKNKAAIDDFCATLKERRDI